MKHAYKIALGWLLVHWRGVLSTVIIGVITFLTLITQFRSLVLGQNRFETITLYGLQTAPEPWFRAVDAPYTVTAYLFGKVFDNPLYGARFTSVVFGIFAIALFYILIKLWFSNRIAIVGSLLFLTSSWFLHISHQAAPFILMVLSILALFCSVSWFLRTKKHKYLSFILFAIALGLSAYVPFMPWVVAILMIILLLKEKHSLLKLNRVVIVAAAIVYFIILAPLFISLASHPGQIKELLGLPQQVPTIYQYFSQLYHSSLMIFITSPKLPELHLGNLAMLDLFSTATFLLGIYYYYKRLPKRRSLTILSTLLLLLLIVALSPNYQLWIAVLLPLVYICIAAGIVELLNQWFSYFPRNSLARNIGVTIIVIAIGFTSFYHLERYFIAWPNSPATKSVYVVKSK